MRGPIEQTTWSDDPVEVLLVLYPFLLADARRAAADRQDAEDLVQEALIRTLVRYPNLAELKHPLGYTRTALWRLAFARRRLRWVEIPVDTAGLMERTEQGVAPEEAAALQEGLGTLGPRQRACLTLRHFHGLDDRAIAVVLGCSTSTVRSQAARGLARLRQVMKEVPEDEAR